ncbi:MAG TPA: hypothetical protein VIE65_17980 [Methylobacter sp.]
MDYIELIVNLMLLVFALVFTNYLREKGKNVASKEDIQHLTELVEGVKLLHASEIERLKSSLQNEFEIIERRRRVYEEICNSMRLFVHGNDATPEAKERFLMAYSAAWLWASDAVLISLNLFVDQQIKHAKNPSSNDGFVLECAYREVVSAMREDAGFDVNKSNVGEYKFVYF